MNEVAYMEDTGVEQRILCLECGEGSKDVLVDDHPDALRWYTGLTEGEVPEGAVCAECKEVILEDVL